ncbi:hypothetical protein QAD02_006584 [Eretmocerus hayati]|uniref:Uncharacterized protein n=1 Tax=Eretmocerus hayati TaxID=131215 RepID=A0ACC2N1D2_9HYME|nr:hypothetical protein QAD02_006584 [Eretmocerus hayati]
MFATVWIFLIINQFYTNAEPILGVRSNSKIEHVYVVGLAIKSENGQISNHVCTGSLITSTHVITSARCTKISMPGTLVIAVRKLDEKQKKYQKDFIDIVRQDTYKEWHQMKFNAFSTGQDSDDISILTMKERIPKIIPIVPIYSGNKKILDSKKYSAIGWGRGSGMIDPNNPLRTTLQFLKNSLCKQQLELNAPKSMKFTVPHRVACAKAATGTALVDGDFGGPVYDHNGRMFGITLRKVEGMSDGVQENIYLVLILSEFKDFIHDIIARPL